MGLIFKKPIMPKSQLCAKREAGFVLVATLWVMAGLTLLAAYIDQLTDNNIERAIEQKAQLQVSLDRLSTENTLIYLIATNRLNHTGLLLEQEQVFSGLSFDDKALPLEPTLKFNHGAYLGLGDIRFSLNDDAAALVSVNSPKYPGLNSAMESVGISPSRRATIIARLIDYIDADHSLTLNGAEFYEYRSNQVPLPSNFLLATPLEFRSILGFDKLVTEEQWSKLRPMLTMRQALGNNFNLMSPKVMSIVLGLNESSLDPLLLEREQKVISSENQIQSILGSLVRVDEDEIRRFPSRFIRITTWHRNSRQYHLTGVEFTPFVDQSPWRIDYNYTEQQHAAASGKAKKVLTPLLQ